MSHFPVFYDANGKALAIFARICYTIGRYFNFFGAFMIKNITLNGQTITYDLQRKKVKNINLRMKRTGEITVSANPRVPDAIIEGFLCEHADRILRAIRKSQAKRALADGIHRRRDSFGLWRT